MISSVSVENFDDSFKEELAEEVEKKVLMDKFRRKKQNDSNSSEGYEGSNSSSDETLASPQESGQRTGDRDNTANRVANRLNKNEVIERETRTHQNQTKSKITQNWGEDVGIYDQNGETKRVVSLSELTNYFEMRLKNSNRFKFYIALIDSRYPRLFKQSLNGSERWRMRYNMFADGVFGKCDEQCVLHIGEVMIYFDVTKAYFYPYYVNCSFYGNYRPITKPIQNSTFNRMMSTVKYVLTSNNILQLKFPIAETKFRNRNKLYDEFAKNQNHLINASINLCANALLSGKRLNINSFAKLSGVQYTDRKFGSNFASDSDKRGVRDNRKYNKTNDNSYRNTKFDANANTSYYHRSRDYQNNNNRNYSSYDERQSYRPFREGYSARNNAYYGYEGNKNYCSYGIRCNNHYVEHTRQPINNQKAGDDWKAYRYDNNSSKYGYGYKTFGYSKPNTRAIYY